VISLLKTLVQLSISRLLFEAEADKRLIEVVADETSKPQVRFRAGSVLSSESGTHPYRPLFVMKRGYIGVFAK
jgi:hypothetical protein